MLLYLILAWTVSVSSAVEQPSGEGFPDTIPSGVQIFDTLTRRLDEVVITAFNRREDIVKIPGALTSVGQLVLQSESPPINILPVFDLVPGVFAHEGAINTSRVVIRGTGARVPYATGKIRAYFNNIPLTNTSGETFVQDIDPGMIQSMEVIKGPAPSIYGAGLGGTIVLNALDPAARTTGISNTSRAGAFGLIRNSTTLDYVRDNHATSVVYSYTQSDGYRENNEFRRNAVTLVNQFAPGNTELTSLLSFSDLRHHIPSSIDSVTFADNPQAAAANWLGTRGYEDGRRLLAGVNASHQTLPQLTTNLSVFGIWHDEKEMRPFDVYYQERLTLGTRLRLVYSQPVGTGELEFSAGGEAFTENYQYSNHENIGGEGVQGDPFSDNSEQVGSWNLFSQADATFGRFTLTGGINLNFTQRDYRDNFSDGNQNLSGIYDYGLMISPRLAAGYLYAGQNSVYVSVSHGFAPPSLDETLTPEGTINPDIMPETSWNYEVGFRGKLLRDRLYYDVSLYNMQVQNLLVAERVGEDAWIGRNAGASLHRGLEAELHGVILRNSPVFRELSLRANATLNDFTFTDFIDREVDYGGNTLPGVPDRVLYASLYAQSFGGFYLQPAGRYVGEMAMNDANTSHTQSYFTADITAGYKSTRFNQLNLDLFLRVNNLFDKHYASMILVNAPSFGDASPRYYYPGLPRHFVVGLRMGLPV